MGKINAVIIGAGSIGALKPDELDYPGSKNILTHANAFQRHDLINLVGIIDIDRIKSDQAGKKWECSNYYSVAEAFTQFKQRGIEVDIVSVCIPTGYHHTMMIELLSYEFKLMIAEKPFCSNSGEAMNIIKQYKKVKRPIIVDYIRHFDPQISDIKNHIEKSSPNNEMVSTRIIYNRGLKHEGCHAIALCNHLFGHYKGGQILKSGHIKELDNDVSYAVQMNFQKCNNIILTPLDGRNYSIFDVDIFSKTGRFNLIDHGKNANVYFRGKENTYGNYISLDYDCSNAPTELAMALLYVVRNAINHLDSNEPIICTAEDALKVHTIYENLIEEKNNEML